MWLHVRATAVFGIAFAALLFWLYRSRSPHLRPALVLLALLAVQMAIGELQYRNRLPWWLVLGHVTTARARVGRDGRPRRRALESPVGPATLSMAA